jgi:hypothetical protein
MLLLGYMFDLTIRQVGPRRGDEDTLSEPEGRGAAWTKSERRRKAGPQECPAGEPGNAARRRHIMSDMGLERPVADSLEQSRDVIADRTEPDEYSRPREVPLEANEADAAEQERALGHDEDDYR